MAAPNVSQIATVTLRHRSKKLADNVTNNIALLNKLRRRGNVRTFSGGRTIMEELAYAENPTYMEYSGFDTLSTAEGDEFSSPEFEIKQAAVAVVISGLSQLQNAGPEQAIDLLTAKIANAERTFMNNHSTAVYSDGTGSGGKQIGGLQLLVSDAGTGTVGGINSSTFTFFQNKVFDFSANSLTPGPSTIQQAMQSLHLDTLRNNDHIDLWVADNTYYQYYWQSLTAIQRVTSDDKASAGYMSLSFPGGEVVCDGGLGGSAPASHMYGLNTNYLFYRPHRNRNIVPLSPDRYATNQDAMVRFLAFAGNMTISNRSLQGVIVA